MNTVIERWRTSISYPDYDISNLGRVYNWKRDRLMNQARTRSDRCTPSFYLKLGDAKSREVRITVLMKETWKELGNGIHGAPRAPEESGKAS